jgi:hypothetical protein
MAKTFDLKIDPSEVMHTGINTSKRGYNSANMHVKRGENEYLTVSYEWEGEKIPGFAMDLMMFMQRNNVEKSSVWPGKEVEYAEYKEKISPAGEK